MSNQSPATSQKDDSFGCIVILVIALFGFGSVAYRYGTDYLETRNKAAELQLKQEQRLTMSGTVKEIRFSGLASSSELTTVVFDDGRQKYFWGLPDNTVKAGDLITITYNGVDRIISVEIKK